MYHFAGSKFVVDPVNELPPSPCLTPLPELARVIQTTAVEMFPEKFIQEEAPPHTRLEPPHSKSTSTIMEIHQAEMKKLKPGAGGAQCKPDTGIISRLQKLKAARRSQSPRKSKSTLDIYGKKEHYILQRVKTQECCTVM